MLQRMGGRAARILALAGGLMGANGPACAAGSDGGQTLLDLEDALRLGREHSKAVQAAEARARGAAEMRWEGLGYLLPKVDVQAAAIRTEQPGEVFGLGMNRRDDMVGLMGRAFGMTADAQGRLSTLGMDNDVFVDPDPMTTYVTRVVAEMPLFTGGMIVNRVRQADLMADAQELKSGREIGQVDFEVATAWTNLAKAREYRDLLERARATTKAHVQMARDYREVGFLVASEVLRAEVYLAEMDELVLRAENGTALAQAALNFHLGLDQRTMHQLGALPGLPGEDPLLDEWTERGLETRPDLAAARKQLKAGQLEEWVAGAAFLPTVGLQGSYDWYDQALEAGRENLRVTEERFREGVARMIDLLDAETALREAEVRELVARYDSHMAAFRLRHAAGLDIVDMNKENQ